MDFENSTLGKIEGKGKIYMDWLVNILKPEIDKKYRTMPERENTIIAGSSMGGLMALYGATEYNHIFQRAACLSPSLWVNPAKVLEITARANIKTDTCIYMDYGSQEIFNHAFTTDALIATSQLLLRRWMMESFPFCFRYTCRLAHTKATDKMPARPAVQTTGLPKQKMEEL